MKKTCLAAHFTKACFLSNCSQKTDGFSAKALPACCRYKPGFYFFSLHKIKMSKQHAKC